MAFCNPVRRIDASGLMIAGLLFASLGLPKAVMAQTDSKTSQNVEAQSAVKSSNDSAQHEIEANEQPVTRAYQVKCVTVEDLKAIVKPLLTQRGYTEILDDQASGRPILLVQDVPSVLQNIDAIIAKMDVQPGRVSIEALIAEVTLTDTEGLESGSWEKCRGLAELIGTPVSLSSPDLNPEEDTQKIIGCCDGNVTEYVPAFEKSGSARILANLRVFLANKQRAELRHCDKNMRVRVRFRPFISPDDVVRIEIHWEVEEDTGNVYRLKSRSTTTNVTVRNGSTGIAIEFERDEPNSTDEVPASKAPESPKKVLLIAFTPKVQK